MISIPEIETFSCKMFINESGKSTVLYGGADGGVELCSGATPVAMAAVNHAEIPSSRGLFKRVSGLGFEY